jgi:hypothetical protein
MIFDIIRVATSQRTKTSPNPDAPQGMIELRDKLDGMLQHIRQSHHIKPATASMLCPCCQAPMVQGSPSVSVRATILALARFGIAPGTEVKSLEGP